MIRRMMWLETDICDQIQKYFDEGEFVDGKNTGSHDRNIKRTQQLVDKSKGTDVQGAVDLWEEHFWRSPLTSAMCVKKTTGPMFVKYSEEEQGHYDFHNDAPIMNRHLRSDYIMTTALNDGTEYEGGELDIRLGSETYSHKLNKGECILFDPNLWHRVKPVTKGERRVCITWIQTLIQDVFIRELLYDYQDLEFYAMNAIDKDKWMHDVEPATYFNQIRYKLIRQYSSTYDD